MESISVGKVSFHRDRLRWLRRKRRKNPFLKAGCQKTFDRKIVPIFLSQLPGSPGTFTTRKRNEKMPSHDSSKQRFDSGGLGSSGLYVNQEHTYSIGFEGNLRTFVGFYLYQVWLAGYQKGANQCQKGNTLARGC